ncbi:Methylase involved in ubiquinone/menaquinone biosynthesis [Hyella patelloides LEGE 07179]|uniref:Methylase involved in ubiquinone/menaquinone biosynthesis n=1 Tax=Hyella patelloides LEGE 07179 TaxID=945734 RepID=A0A563W598_9CYAN|nr:methyltransferase domain-containing protein [Hyella patelloides]VEP18835.1 Methylase involved in ubiquinone/menaquinone biosynthesis [Hyella patelloides LEGE 07179]
MSEQLYQRIGEFYDASSALWEKIWGEHMHHGYYGRNGKYKIERRQAQIELIEELLSWGGVTTKNAPQNILDVGCGIGGSSIYLADKFTADVTGITLSGVQASRAKERAIDAGIEEKIDFQVANALSMPFADNSFDLVWSLESGEHMPDKAQFLTECYRVLKPGGKLILATWCHRETEMSGDLTTSEIRHLKEIYRVYCLPYVIALSEYIAIADRCGFNNIKSDDWSISVAPFWNVVIDSAFDLEAVTGLVKAGWKTIESALSLGLMSQGYSQGLIRYGLLYATK